MSKALLNNQSSLTTNTELTDTPFFPQQKYQCGPAALATVLNHQNQKIQPEALVGKVYIPEKQGSVPLEMISATRGYEQIAYLLDRNLEKLLAEVEAGNPVLVMQNLGFSWRPQWHYAVVVGYDLNKKTIILRSGTEKRRIMPLTTFERTWRRAKYWALVVIPPTEIPATAEAPRYLKTAHDLEITGHSTAAEQAYQAAIKRWPDNSSPWLALGNLHYIQENFAQAEKTFKQALLQHPDTAELWNNLGYSLMAQGCQSQAIKAAQCAINLQPENINFSESLSDLTASQKESTVSFREINCHLKTAN